MTHNADLPPRTADQISSQSEQKKIWPLCSKGQKLKTLGEENGSINWTKIFSDECIPKKTQFNESVMYFTQKNRWFGQGYSTVHSSEIRSFCST